MNILLAIDGSEASMMAVPVVKGLTLPAGSVVELLTVIPEDPATYGPWPAVVMIQPPEELDESIAAARTGLEAIAADLATDGRTIRSSVRHGRPATEIVLEAGRIGADLIVVGARGHTTIERIVIGSVSSEVVDQSHCPVLVVRTPRVDRVLLATDGSADGDVAASFIDASGCFGDPILKVLCVVEPGMPWWAGISPVDERVAADTYVTVRDAAERHASEVAHTTAQRLGAGESVGEAMGQAGDVGSTIVAEAVAWHADVIVLGTRGHGVLHRALVGSTSRHVLHHAPMSVLIVRPAPVASVRSRADAA